MNLSTILFDLDGTLLPLDMEKFMSIYFGEMGKFFADLINPKELVSSIWKATGDMVKNTDFRTNEEVFMESFEKYIGKDITQFKERFDYFYDEGFLAARDAVIEVPIIKDIVNLLKEKGYQMVIATNALFPKKAILHRIRWAGFNPEDFIHITSYEKSHYCKPQIKFYEEILQDIKKDSAECIMVGNDVEEDLVAGKLGMETFLIEDFVIRKGEDKIESTYKGTYEDFYKFVESLPDIQNFHKKHGCSHK
ncbi:MAG: HAD family hydrolase [Epulopiscium sp.]|nr:HAD family hydrolase [Candidatus Epulonipiscium sp.]